MPGANGAWGVDGCRTPDVPPGRPLTHACSVSCPQLAGGRPDRFERNLRKPSFIQLYILYIGPCEALTTRDRHRRLQALSGDVRTCMYRGIVSSRPCGRMSPIMDKRLRRAPDAEWVLMYRLGLSRKQIADLVGAEPATVGYHLVIARRRDPELETAHLAAAGTKSGPSVADVARMDEVVSWITAQGRFPSDGPNDRNERAMVQWLSDRRREARAGTLHPAYGEGLARVPGWGWNPRTAAGEARWHQRLAQLADFRAEGNDWPRHKKCDSEREHTLGVWVHSQRQKHRRGELEAEKVELMDDAVPGWQIGRTRGRAPRP